MERPAAGAVVCGAPPTAIAGPLAEIAGVVEAELAPEALRSTRTGS